MVDNLKLEDKTGKRCLRVVISKVDRSIQCYRKWFLFLVYGSLSIAFSLSFPLSFFHLVSFPTFLSFFLSFFLSLKTCVTTSQGRKYQQYNEYHTYLIFNWSNWRSEDQSKLSMLKILRRLLKTWIDLLSLRPQRKPSLTSYVKSSK